MNLRPYQKEIVEKINQSKSRRNCVQLATGAGKTIIFSHLAKQHKGRVLILVNRVELLEQTFNTIRDGVAKYDSKTKKIPTERIIIGMIETIARRKSFNINDFDLLIIDEAHYLQFVKVIEPFKGRLIGFTATPITNKVNYFETEEGEKFRQNETLKKYYGELITGIDIPALIEKGYLVRAEHFVIKQDLSKLKTDRSGEYTNESLDKLYQQKQSVEAVYKNYLKYSFNKKTLIFSNSIKTNDKLYSFMKQNGVNCRKFDSNSSDRSELVEWFRNTPDAVLLNVSVFVAGFDVDDVETIILNRATTSLSLYIQAVGRGSRPTKKIYKDHFKVIDLGNNFYKFGEFEKCRNWKQLYEDTEIKKVNTDLLNIVSCKNCEAIILKSDSVCQFCGEEKPVKKVKVKKESFEIAVPLNEFRWPKAAEVVKHCERNELTISDAFRIVSDLFMESLLHSNFDVNRANRDEVLIAIKKRFNPFYFAIMNSSLKGNRKRKIITLVYSIYDKIFNL